MKNPALFSESVGGVVAGISAPIKGLNTQSSLAGLSPDYAIQLDNWICQPDSLVTRLGCANHVTGFASNPKTLMVYSSATSVKMFAASANGIYDVTSPGVVGAAVIALTSGYGNSVNFATSAGQYLVYCNGVDSAKQYDGTTWSASGVTGPALTSLKAAEAYRQRLFFLQNDFLGFYYLGADAIGGAATAFRIGSLCRRGGEVTAQGTWTIDGGSGPDDHYVLYTSEGELVVFRGSDPAVLANWTYVGTYYIGRPTGTECLKKFGGDLLILSENGIIPMSTLSLSTTRDYQNTLTSRIQPTIANASALYGSQPGWKIHPIPRLSLLLVNSPTSSSLSTQYVYHTVSKGWSTFSGWNAADFIEFNGSTYLTTGTSVVKAFTGFTDYGSAITAICDTAYNRFGTRQQQQLSLIRAIFAASTNVSYTLGIAQDFSGNYSENFYAGSNANVGFWDSGLWDTAAWGGSFNLRRDWVTIASEGGIALSTRFKVQAKDSAVVLLALDYKLNSQGLLF